MTSPNAPLLTRMNTLKQAEFSECLTDTQSDALDAIQDYREGGEPYVNVYGPPEAGKTFLCWALQETGWAYYQALPDRVTETTVIFDHGSPEKQATRQLRNKAEMNGVACAVYVTRKAAEEVYPRVELTPPATHYEKIAENWNRLGLNPEAAPSETSERSLSSPNNGDRSV